MCDNNRQPPTHAREDSLHAARYGQPPHATQDERDLQHYESRFQRPVRMKMPEFERNERLRHVIFSGQFSVDMLEDLAGTADKIRMLSKMRGGQDFLIHLLNHKRAMLYFTQPSTRTFLSFMAACQILGITCNEVRDPIDVVGNQGRNAVRFDPHVLQLLRPDHHAEPSSRGWPKSCAYLMNDLEASGNRSVPIVNAGSGADEHPTQALLDIYTLQRTFQFANPQDSPVANRFDELRRGLPRSEPRDSRTRCTASAATSAAAARCDRSPVCSPTTRA